MTPEAALAAISAALFPTPVKGWGGYLISGDACLNLQGALIDLERLASLDDQGAENALGQADPAADQRRCVRTISCVHQQLLEVKRLLREAGFE